MKLKLSGNPLSTQSVYRNHGHIRFMTNEARARKEQYQWEATSQWKGPIIKTPFNISVKLYFGDKRKRDWDNFHKISMDALTGIVWEDDSLIQTATVEKLFDKDNPRIEIEVN